MEESQRACHEPRRVGFTLVELLVVVAIIALLISILLPSLRYAKAQARSVKCRAQLREYGMGFDYYLQEFNETFPPHKHPGGHYGRPPYWFHLIDRYWIEASDSEWYNEATQKLGADTFQLARCPDLAGPRQDNNLDWEWEYDRERVGYGYNAYWLGYYAYTNSGYANARTVVWRRLSEVRSAAECVLVGDSNPKPDGDWSSTLWWPFIALEAEGVATRHCAGGAKVISEYRGARSEYPDGVGNIIFVDGHGEARISGQINDLVEHRRFWDPGQGVGGWW